MQKVFAMTLGIIAVLFMSTTHLSAGGVTDGMVAYWQFEGNTTDSSGLGHTGSLYGSQNYVESMAELGYSLYFDGNRDYMTVADDSYLHFTDTFTISAWINPTTVSVGDQAIVAKLTVGNAQYHDYVVGLYHDDFRAIINYNNTSVIPGDIIAGEWQHVAYTYENSIVKIYYNGVYIGEWDSGYSSISADSRPIYIGGREGSSDKDYEGYMDEIKMFNRALSDAEILQEYNHVLSGGATVPEPATLVLTGLGMIALIRKKMRT